MQLKPVGIDGVPVRCTVAAFPVRILDRDLVATVITEHERPGRNHGPNP
ncbi:MAG: hypothetical protein WBI63_07035 [Coriobacteriia bacterium]